MAITPGLNDSDQYTFLVGAFTLVKKQTRSPTPFSPLMYKTYRYQKYSETPKGLPTKFFGNLSQKCREFFNTPSTIY